MNTCKLCGCGHLNNKSVAYCSDCLKIVNDHPQAEFIETACNTHKRLIDACRELVYVMPLEKEAYPDNQLYRMVMRAIKNGRAALVLAGEKRIR